jgi:hypothetical protein
LFSTTLIRKTDPLSTTVLAFSTPYAPSILFSPLGATFIILVGIGTILYSITHGFISYDCGTLGYFIFIPPIQEYDILFILFI